MREVEREGRFRRELAGGALRELLVEEPCVVVRGRWRQIEKGERTSRSWIRREGVSNDGHSQGGQGDRGEGRETRLRHRVADERHGRRRSSPLRVHALEAGGGQWCDVQAGEVCAEGAHAKFTRIQSAGVQN